MFANLTWFAPVLSIPSLGMDFLFLFLFVLSPRGNGHFWCYLPDSGRCYEYAFIPDHIAFYQLLDMQETILSGK
jgi:hypothetical protein